MTLPTSTGSPTPDEAKQIAKAAYVFGFPLVVMNGTEAQLTNVPSAETFSAPVNQFNTPSTPVTPSFTAVPAAPVDVLFSNAWLDLSKEPLVFTMPNTNGVYNQMTILSGWTNVLAAPGKRTTGTGGGNFLIAGPGWRGKVPAGMTLIKLSDESGVDRGFHPIRRAEFARDRQRHPSGVQAHATERLGYLVHAADQCPNQPERRHVLNSSESDAEDVAANVLH